MLHTIPPIYDSNSKVLILGSFPSVKSREIQFFYGHPQNRFWRVMAEVLNCNIPASIEEKRAMLINNGIALWDVIYSCDIEGSDDASIRNVIPNDLALVINNAQIKRIFTNGKTANRLYEKYCIQSTSMSSESLPSTSPANAGYSFEKLVNAWKVVADA